MKTKIYSKIFGELALGDIYTGNGNWYGDSVYITISNVDEVHAALDLLEKFFANQKTWDAKFRTAAIKELTPMVNDWKKTSEIYKDYPNLTEAEFSRRMWADTVHMSPDGNFAVMYLTYRTFCVHEIEIYGNIERGIDEIYST